MYFLRRESSHHTFNHTSIAFTKLQPGWLMQRENRIVVRLKWYFVPMGPILIFNFNEVSAEDL